MFIRKTFTVKESIVTGCLKGDLKAQRQLYEAYSGKFLALCCRYVKDRDLAEDVMIEGFMKIFEKLPQFEHKGSFEGWMRKVMVNQALLTLRKNKHLAMEINYDGQQEVQGSYEAPADLEAEDLMRLVQELPVGYRTVFNLYAIEGYSHKEIQDLLGISESTSKSQLSRARALLQQKLNKSPLDKTNTHG
jgi:RNA polymerase sigma factor (sigma-70 family)